MKNWFFGPGPERGARRIVYCLLLSMLVLPAFHAGASEGGPPAEQEIEASEAQGPTFEVKFYSVEGNTIFPRRKLRQVLKSFTGPDRTAADVEKARSALEKFYQDQGYVRVMVNIPEQEVDGGIVRFQVVETSIGGVRVTGNRYFTMEKIMEELPSLKPGSVLYVPEVEKDFAALNRTPDMKVKINLVPTREPGVDNLELQVQDDLPLHGSVEVSNRASHDTSELRLNASVRYDNLWQKKHSAGLQYQTAPLEPGEVQVVGGSYIFSNPWRKDHTIAAYALWTDSDTAFGQGFQVLGSGTILGVRYMAPLPPVGKIPHSLTFGADYKDFDETTAFGDDREKVPISYLPFTLSYGGLLSGKSGDTRVNAGVNFSFRGLVGEQQEFEDKRFKARGSYIFATLGIERLQRLPHSLELKAAVDGQIASEPLVSSEQYSAGGMSSVRGYRESEALGDHALHAVLELSAADLAAGRPWLPKGCLIKPFVFLEGAWLKVKEPLSGQEDTPSLLGTGVGLRGRIGGSWDFETDWGVALQETNRTESGANRLHFRLKYQF